MPREEVVIMYNDEDSGTWPEYLQGQIAKEDSVSAKTFLVSDRTIFETMDTRSENRILKSKVIVIIVTPLHVEYLQGNNRASYERLVPTGDNGIMLLLGIEVEELQGSMMYGKFPEFEKWTKIVYKDDTSIKDLLVKTVEIIERPERLKSGFTVIPTTLICEEDTTVSIMIDEPIPDNYKVAAVIKHNTGLMDKTIPANRINPHCYSIVMPESEECEATIYIDVNGQSLGSQQKVIYKSYLKTEDAVAVNELYCHCLAVLCKVVLHQQNMEDMDQKLSEIFDHMVDLPIKGFENLFGIYQYFTAEASRTELPTLVHLAAKYNLQETLSRLQDQRQFIQTCSIINKDGLRPLEIAERKGHLELANFMKEFEEQMDIYASMCTSYVSGSSTKESYYNVKNEERIPDVKEDYLDMEFEQKPKKKSVKKRPPPAAFPEDPSENYLPMGGSTSGTANDEEGNDSDQSGYEGVQDWRELEAQEQTNRSSSAPQSRNNIPHTTQQTAAREFQAPSAVNLQRSADDAIEAATEEEEPLTVSGTSQDLIQLQQKYKDGKVSLEQVETLFQQWQQDRSGSAKSFQEKQAMMKETRKHLDKAKQHTKSVFRGLNKKADKKKEKKMMEEEEKRPTYKVVQKMPSVKRTSPKPLPKTYKEESPYASRDAMPPPVPNRRFIQEDLPPKPTRDRLLSPREEEHEPVDYLEFEEDNDEDYTYVEKEISILPPEPSRHDFPVPSVPAGHDPQENYIDMERASSYRGSSRLSNASTSSRTSSMSTGSGRESTVSSGIDVSCHSLDDLEEEPGNVDDYVDMQFSRSSPRSPDKITRHPHSARGTGLQNITESHLDDYDAQSEKRKSIENMNLPAPPPIPSRAGRLFPPPPPSPGTPQDTETSIPLEAPPPIPDIPHHHQMLQSVEEEEPQEELSPQETHSMFLSKVVGQGAMASPQAAIANLFGKGLPQKPKRSDDKPRPPRPTPGSDDKPRLTPPKPAPKVASKPHLAQKPSMRSARNYDQ